MSALATLEKLLADQQLLITQQSAALLALLERVAVLERAMEFEVNQREALETIIARVANLPRRMDHVEREIIEIRKLPRGVRVVAK